MQCLCSLEHLVGSGADTDVLGKIGPAYDSARVHQEFGRSGNVMAIGTTGDVEEMVTANHVGIRIGKDREGIPCLFAEISRDLRRVDADRDGLDPSRLEFSQSSFNAS